MASDPIYITPENEPEWARLLKTDPQFKRTVEELMVALESAEGLSPEEWDAMFNDNEEDK